MKIALDIMGGDFAPEAIVAGAVLAHGELPADVRLVLIGDTEKFLPLLKKHKADEKDFDIVHAPEVIGMGDNPTKAFSQKPNSSIVVGFNLLKQKKVDGFASVGNSGAMMVGSMFMVKTIPGVIRPCIPSALPKMNDKVGVILDVGINADCKPDVLYQFGVLGSIYAENVFGIRNPRVALLNIGEEPEKGNLVTQAAYTLMKDNKDFNFIGNVEGRDLFNERSDVIVCEGFTGNVVLKEAEAFYTIFRKLGKSDLYMDRFNYENHGAAPVLGINSTVMIGHGISNDRAVRTMILQTRSVVEAQLPEKIKQAFN